MGTGAAKDIKKKKYFISYTTRTERDVQWKVLAQYSVFQIIVI